MEQSRRDDMESIGYVIMYFLRGNLPWQGLKIKSKEDKYKKILDKKKETSSKELCLNFPNEFYEYVEYTRNLEYEEEPKYEKFRMKFYNLICNKRGESFDYIYDWTTESDIKKREQAYNNDLDFKATATKDAETKGKNKEKEIIQENKNGNNYNYNDEYNNINNLVESNNLNNLIQSSNKEDYMMNIEENNIVHDKVDSRCFTIF